jgi:hypothetical protein
LAFDTQAVRVGGDIAVDTADFVEAAAAMFRACAAVSGLPGRVLAGAHDTHAAQLDLALDVFARQAEVATGAVLEYAYVTGLLLECAARGFTAVELALARAMSP